MDEQQIRALVREALARHHGAPVRDLTAPAPAMAPTAVVPSSTTPHASVAQFMVVRPAGESDCVIEPSVTCNHCGHCLCLGH